MFTTEVRMQKLLAANAKTLARIDQILSGEDSTSGTHDVDCATCTYTEAARRLRYARPTIYRMVQAGRLKTVPLNGSRGRRILISSLVDYVNGNK